MAPSESLLRCVEAVWIINIGLLLSLSCPDGRSRLAALTYLGADLRISSVKVPISAFSGAN